MAKVILFLPSGEVETYDPEAAPGVNEAGILRFRDGDADVVTNLPFVVRYPVKEKSVTTTTARPQRRTSSGHTAWS